MKKRIFISSVQSEFAKERRALHEYICSDPLLGKFFDPFIFELLPAVDSRTDEVFLKEIEQAEEFKSILYRPDFLVQDEEVTPKLPKLPPSYPKLPPSYPPS